MAYTTDFYDAQSRESRASARAVVPLVMDLVKPRSVVDIGCGVGTWLAEFAEAGATDILGVDGEYVLKNRLHVPRESFMPADLSQPLTLPRRYDLAVSLEVAEHLDSSLARTFVKSLTDAAPVVLFSAAVRGQGGTHHVNEQWPDYWREIFRGFDYHVADVIRTKIWGNASVAYYYQQNILLYLHSDIVPDYPQIQVTPASTWLSLVHPQLYIEHEERLPSLSQAAQLLSVVLRRSARWHAKRLLTRVKQRFGRF